MREIKFRAWNFKDKKMFSAEEMTVDQMAILPDGHFANIDGQHTSRSIIYSHEQMLPLQYTGLKDKNGKEIYEGDILRREIGETIHRAAVTFEEGRFVTSHPGGGIGWTVNSATSEVIGNIYENPELLK